MRTLTRKKILFFIPTLAQGGGERVVSELSLHLPDFLESIIVLFENRISYPYKGRVLDLGTRISTSFFLRICYFFLRLFRFRRILEAERPDYVVSLGNSPNIINLLANKNPIVRVDLPVSKSNRGFWGNLYKVFVRLLFNRARYVIAVSRFIARDLAENFSIDERKIRIIHNPVDIEKIRRLSQEPIDQQYQEIFTYPVIITMGRLTEQKGQGHLIKAFFRVKDAMPDAKLVILGEGERKNFLLQLSRDLNLERDVHLLGWHKNPFAFVSRAKLFVLSSLWEGLPDVLLEAMACGLSVISTDCKSGPREILAPSTDVESEAKDIEHVEYGILVPVCASNEFKPSLEREEEMLSEAMLRLLRDSRLSLEFAKKARERAEDFRIGKIMKEWSFLQ